MTTKSMYTRDESTWQFKNNKNLASAAGKKGGSAKTINKKISARFRVLREIVENGGDISKYMPYIYKLATNPEIAATDLMDRIHKLIDAADNDSTVDLEMKNKLIRTYNDIYRSIHKQFYNITQVNINAQAEEEIDEYINAIVEEDNKPQ